MEKKKEKRAEWEDAEPIIMDGNYDMFGKDPEGYRSTVLETIRRILFLNTKLLSASGKFYIKVGDEYVQQEENTLKVYYQLVEFLEDMLSYVFDAEIIKVIEEENKNIKNVFGKYFEIFISRQVNEARAEKLRFEGIIPREDALGKWCWEQIEEETKQCYRRKFRGLLLLYKRENELSNTSYASMEMPQQEEEEEEEEVKEKT